MAPSVDVAQWNHSTYLLSTPASVEAASASKPTSRRGTPPDHIPRPPNAFILFRKANAHRIPRTVTKDQKRISRSIGELWRGLSEDERAYWQEQAEQAKREHAARWPDYVFHPVKKTVVPRKRKVKGSGAADKQRDKEVARLMRAGKDGDALARAVRARDEGRDEVAGHGHGHPEILAPTPSYLANPIPEYRSWHPQAPLGNVFDVDAGAAHQDDFSPLMSSYDYIHDDYLGPIPDSEMPSPLGFNSLYIDPLSPSQMQMHGYDFTHY